MKKGLWRAQRAMCCMALVAALCLSAVLCVCAMLFTSNLTTTAQMSESTAIVQDALIPGVILTLAMLAGLCFMHAVLERFAHIHLTGILAAMWLVAALVFLLGMQLQQLYDFAYVVGAAKLLAQGNYKVMTADYYNAYSYQLGFCLPMEIVLRVLPWVDIDMFMQVVNAMLSVASAGALAALCELLSFRRARSAAAVLYLTFLPALFYCTFVYATLPIVFLCSFGFLCFALYLRKRRLRFAIVSGLFVAVAVMLKPNAMVPLLALVICALVDCLTSGDWKLLLCMLLSAALAVLLARAVIWQYELRSGVTLAPDISAVARLSMGLQRNGSQAGWYNRYFEQFYPLDVTMEQEYAIAKADIAARLTEFAADPAMAAHFVWDKMLSQWLEPTFGTMWYGNLCEQTGRLAGMARNVYAQRSALRAGLEAYMDIWLQAMYLLATLGMVDTLRRRDGVARLILPVTILGAFLYHMIFEAKSQYIYVYVFYMIPIAAQGLCVLENALHQGLCERVRS